MKLRDKKFWTEGYGSILVVFGIAMTIRWAFVEAYVIPTGSMLPSLLVHDHIFVNKLVYGLRVPFTGIWLIQGKDPQRGEVIVFRYPENEKLFYIKRVVGVPGDKVDYRSGELYVNGQLVERKLPNTKRSDFDWLRDEDFLRFGLTKSSHEHWEESLGGQPYSIIMQEDVGFRGNFGPYEVPKDSYFVMGDNRDNSTDSRRWTKTHFVQRDQLIGRAMFVWLSCHEMLPVVKFLCNPKEIRWRRFFHSVH